MLYFLILARLGIFAFHRAFLRNQVKLDLTPRYYTAWVGYLHGSGILFNMGFTTPYVEIL